MRLVGRGRPRGLGLGHGCVHQRAFQHCGNLGRGGVEGDLGWGPALGENGEHVAGHRVAAKVGQRDCGVGGGLGGLPWMVSITRLVTAAS